VKNVPLPLSTRHASLGVALLALPLLAGCNLFSFLDGPGNSAQYLSKARACLDAGDIECARENYALISGDATDEARSEEAFAILTDEGIDLGDFFGALTETGTGSGTAINSLANKLAGLNPGERKRNAVFEAYRLSLQISSDSLRGLTRMVTSMTLVAEMLAETAGDDGIVNAGDLVENPTACSAAADCAFEAGCAPASRITDSTTLTTEDWEETGIETLDGPQPSMEMIRAGISQIQVAFGELGQETSGGSTGDASEFADSFEGLPTTGEAIYDQCYLDALLDQGIGQ
jgi:hypothetical protein